MFFRTVRRPEPVSVQVDTPGSKPPAPATVRLLLARTILREVVDSASRAKRDDKTSDEDKGRLSSGVFGSFLADVATAQARAGDVPEAQRTAALLEGSWHMGVALAPIAAAQVRAKDIRGAIDTAERIANLIKAGGEPRTISILKDKLAIALGWVCAGQAAAGDIATALNTASQIKDNYGRGNAVLGIANARLRSGDLDAAKRILTERPEIRARASDDVDPATMLAVLQDQASWDKKAADDFSATQNVSALLGPHEDVGFAYLVGRQAAVDRAAADRWIKAVGSNPDLKEAAVALVFGLLWGGYRQGAIDLARMVKDPLTRHASLALIARDHAESGDFAAAFTTMKEVRTGAVQGAALADIALLQSVKGDREGAKATLRRAIPLVEATREVAGRINALCTVARVQAQLGNTAAAERAIQDARRSSKMDRTISNGEDYHLLGILQAQIDAGDVDGARKTAHDYTGSMKTRALCLAGTALVKAGRIGDARATWEAALDEVSRQNAYSRQAGFEEVAQAQAFAGDEDGALRWARALQKPHERATALRGVSEGLLLAEFPRPKLPWPRSEIER